MNETVELFLTSENWKVAFPGSNAGLLALNQVENPPHHPAFEAEKSSLESRLREQYAGLERAALKALPAMSAYGDYYRQFKKTYHVLLQLESVASGQRDIPSVSPLVETMFMAELENQLLTAAHDLDTIQPPISLDVAAGKETYTLMSGKETRLKQGDMFMADRQGVISSIVYGPDRRTRVGPKTRSILYAVYAPAGISRQAVLDHLESLLRYARLCSPEAEVVLKQVFPIAN